MLVTLADIRAATARIQWALRPTPVEPSDTLSARCGRPVLLKPEHRQRAGSFKIRGALNHLATLSPGTAVVAASAGNHAQGVAVAAQQCGLPAVVFMPVAAALPKVDATRAYGAEVRLVGDTVDDCMAAARRHAAETGARYVPPFDDPLVIAGQGTLGVEIAEEAPDAEVVVVPVGGGGLISGVAVALAALRPAVRVVGVEAAGAASMVASLAAGRPVRLEHVATMADGIAPKSPSALTLAHVQAHVDEVVTVTEEEISTALLLVLERSKAVVEPAGVVGLAALLAGKVPGEGPALALLSGGNVDPLLLTKLIEHGLSAAGRYLRVRVVLPDRPGTLADVTTAVACLGVNVLSVEHHRVGAAVEVDEVEVLLTLETRGHDHRDAVCRRLRDQGWRLQVVG